ncbi:MAG: VTT domain-containing protein [Candidatus Moraniibacteriota bacterium]
MILGSLRGFALVPVTYLIVLGLLFFNPLPLFILTIIGILISSISIYFFSEFLRFDAFFEKRYPKQIHRLKTVFAKNELPIIIFWSFFPFLPTDLICYVAGSLRVDLKKLVLGVLIGEGITSGLYIFFENQLIKYLQI